MTGTLAWPENAITSVSVKRHGTVSTGTPLCAKANRVRQQYGLNRMSGFAPAKSYRTTLMP